MLLSGFTDFIKNNFLLLAIFFLLLAQNGVGSEILSAQKDIKKIFESMVNDPKIVIEDMKIVAGKMGFIDEKETKEKIKWKIIGIISLTFNILFILLLIIVPFIEE